MLEEYAKLTTVTPRWAQPLPSPPSPVNVIVPLPVVIAGRPSKRLERMTPTENAIAPLPTEKQLRQKWTPGPPALYGRSCGRVVGVSGEVKA
jgi:hypothetical protein